MLAVAAGEVGGRAATRRRSVILVGCLVGRLWGRVEDGLAVLDLLSARNLLLLLLLSTDELLVLGRLKVAGNENYGMAVRLVRILRDRVSVKTSSHQVFFQVARFLKG